MPTLPNWVVDGAAGFGDSMTLNGTSLTRDLIGANGSVNVCSRAYRNGEFADLAFETGSMGVSALLKHLAKNASRRAVYAESRSQGQRRVMSLAMEVSTITAILCSAIQMGQERSSPLGAYHPRFTARQ